MEYPKPQYEQIEVARLTDQVKNMNGQSSQRLSKCIDKLSELLDKSEELDEETAGESDSLHATE